MRTLTAALLAMGVPCRGQTPAPCSALPGSYCSGGSPLPCPIGSFCTGGAAPNTPCAPATACAVPGLSAQPPCYWAVTTLAGRATTGFANGVGTSASFSSAFNLLVLDNSTLLVADEANGAIRSISPAGAVATVVTGLGNPCSIIADAAGALYVTESASPSRVSRVAPGASSPTAWAGSGAAGSGNGIGTAAQFTGPVQLAFTPDGASVLVTDFATNTVRSIDVATRAVGTAAGSGAAGGANGPALAATFSNPYGLAINASGAVFISDSANNNLRLLLGGAVSTYAGGGGAVEGLRTAVAITLPRALALDAGGSLIVPSNNRVRAISPGGLVSVLAGSGAAAVVDGWGTAASFGAVRGVGVAPTGAIYVTDNDGTYVRQLTCLPCPASYYCSSGAPQLCPAGSACPLSSTSPTPCAAGTWSGAGAASCANCSAGFFAAASNSSGCAPCPSGHFCPPGTASWARLNCGRGNYCPEGSAAPTPCPIQAPPAAGWGAGAQGPAFLVETAACLNHCFRNFSAGTGALSRC